MYHNNDSINFQKKKLTCGRAMSESLAIVRKLLVGAAYSIIFFNVGTASKGNLSMEEIIN